MFGRKRGKVPEEIDPNNLQEEASVQEKENVKKKEEKPTLETLSTQVEKLDLEIKAFNELKKVYDQRFLQITEKIGELRSSLIEKEKKMGEISTYAERAYDIVKSVKPENLLAEVKKLDAKLEAVSGRVDANERVMENIMSEMKQIRKDALKFKGLDEAVVLAKELMKEITEIKKLKSRIDVNTDRVEKIFLEMERRYAEIEDFKERVENLSEAFTSLAKDLNELKVASTNFVKREDFSKFADIIDEKLSFLKSFSEIDAKSLHELLKGIGRIKKEIEVLKDSAKKQEKLEKTLRKMQSSITSFNSRIKGEVSLIKVRQEENDESLKKLGEKIQNLKKEYHHLTTSVEPFSFKKDIESLKNQLSEYKKELESLKESIAEKDIESTVKSLVLTISTLKRSMASLKKQTQELKRELERKKPESEELKKLSSLESIVKGHDSAIREISESIMKMEKAPESLSKETERNTDYLFTKLYNALNSGDVVEAKKIYLKIHKIYEKLPPEDSKCDELYAKLSQAYEMIRKAEGIKSEA